MARDSHRPRSRRRARTVTSRSPWLVTACEPLERRYALAVTWSAGTWTITGDADPTQLDDTIVVLRNPADSRQLQAIVNGAVVGSRLESTVREIRVFGGAGDDAITIDIPGNTRIRTVLNGGAGDDVIVGGPGRDTIYGGRGTDTIVGGTGQDVVYGGAGDDSIAGGAGADTLHGGPGADTLRAGGGRNVLFGGLGRDSFFGRPGIDRAMLAADEQLIGNESTNPLRRLDDMERLQTWYVDAALARWGAMLGKDASPTNRWPVVADGLDRGDAAFLNTSTAGPGGDYSGTNTQVAGVDEGDMVKTDGTHLYVLAGDGVDIVAAWPADQLGVVGHVATPGWERALYLSGSRLTVISDDSSWETVADDPAGAAADARVAWWGQRWRSSVVVTVIDVSVPATPTILETTRLDGWLVDSRAIEGRVLVVTQDSLDIPAPALIAIAPDGTESEASPPHVGGPFVVAATFAEGDAGEAAAFMPSTTAISALPWWGGVGDDGTRYVYEDPAAYRARLERAWASTAIPRFRVTDAAGGETGGDLVAPGRAYLPVVPGDDTLLSVASFEVSDDVVGPDAVTSVAGVTGTVYASTSNLYVSAGNVGNWWDMTDAESTTNVYRFDLQRVDVPLVAMGSVPGTTLNQFSLDESHDGLLRVATTVGFGDAASSGVYVMAASGGNLQTVGSVTGLAPGERIYSARFIGDVGYVSTFREVDPLFVIDLADPLAPRVAGELKVPGYSSYLHPLDATHLLGIGRDVDPTSGEVRGLQLSVFDVSRPEQPRRTSTYTFAGTGWQSWSEALWDHHAVSWFPEQRILAIPVQQGDWWSGSDGLVVFRVDVGATDGFTNLGQISHDGTVQRSLRIGGFIYSISSGEVQVHRLDDPTAEVGRTALTATASDDFRVIFW